MKLFNRIFRNGNKYKTKPLMENKPLDLMTGFLNPTSSSTITNYGNGGLLLTPGSLTTTHFPLVARGVGVTAGGSGVQFTNVPTPFGCNLCSGLPNLLTLILVPNLESIQEDIRKQLGDLIMCMDTRKIYRYVSNVNIYNPTLKSDWQEVRINPDMTVSEITSEVKLQPERKEVYDEFEKHLVERSKDDRNILQKAKDFLTGPAYPAHLATSQP